MASAFLAGLAVGLLWSPCAGPILGAIFSINIAGHSAIATGALLAAYGSGCALMLGLLVFGGRSLMAPLRAKSALMAKLRQGRGGDASGSRIERDGDDFATERGKRRRGPS
jgi:cytochrome c biogenesis protein CcdA